MMADRRLTQISTAANSPEISSPAVELICVHNAGRSQMAAALLSHLARDRIEVRSAGTEPADQINPAAKGNQARGTSPRSVGISCSSESMVSMSRMRGAYGCAPLAALHRF
jgi:Low molecular weight phosphotyrosine protein phosphatase